MAKKTNKTNTHKKEEQQRTIDAKETILEALKLSLGVKTTACNKAGISRTQLYKWINEDEEFAAKVHDLRETALDFVESAMFSQIQNGSTAATIFYLKTQGKDRGYIERSEVDLRNTAPDLSGLSTDELKKLLQEDE